MHDQKRSHPTLRNEATLKGADVAEPRWVSLIAHKNELETTTRSVEVIARLGMLGMNDTRSSEHSDKQDSDIIRCTVRGACTARACGVGGCDVDSSGGQNTRTFHLSETVRGCRSIQQPLGEIDTLL